MTSSLLGSFAFHHRPCGVALAALTAGEGQWLLYGAGAIGFLLTCIAAATVIVVNIRKMREKPQPSPMLIQLEEGFVRRTDFDDFQIDTRNQLKELRAYFHEGVHGINEGLNRLQLAGDQREQRLADKLDAHWKELSRERSVSSARLHERVEASHGQLRQEIDLKVSAVHEKIDDVPQRLIAILRDTGQIGRDR